MSSKPVLELRIPRSLLYFLVLACIASTITFYMIHKADQASRETSFAPVHRYGDRDVFREIINNDNHAN